MKFLWNWAFLAASAAFPSECSTDAQVMGYIQEHLPQAGILKCEGGFVYVDLDDAYIHELIPFIEKEGFVEPPYFESPYEAGAHITVIYPEEVEKYEIQQVEECGETIPFTPVACQIVHPSKLDVEEVFFVTVDAPELDRLREKYGLPTRQYPFHITIGVKPKTAQSA